MSSLWGGITFTKLRGLMWEVRTSAYSLITGNILAEQTGILSSAWPAHSLVKADVSEQPNYTKKVAWWALIIGLYWGRAHRIPNIVLDTRWRTVNEMRPDRWTWEWERMGSVLTGPQVLGEDRPWTIMRLLGKKAYTPLLLLSPWTY